MENDLVKKFYERYLNYEKLPDTTQGKNIELSLMSNRFTQFNIDVQKKFIDKYPEIYNKININKPKLEKEKVDDSEIIKILSKLEKDMKSQGSKESRIKRALKEEENRLRASTLSKIDKSYIATLERLYKDLKKAKQNKIE